MFRVLTAQSPQERNTMPGLPPPLTDGRAVAQASGARCALHSQEAASNVCSRCGTFACERCFEIGADGAALCRRCLEKIPVLADRDSRFLALILDILAYAIPGCLAALMAAVGGMGTLLPMVIGAVGVLGVAGYQLYLCASTGQSIGKRRMGIRVVLEDGEPASLFHILLLRNLIPGLMGYLLGLLVPGILLLVDALFILRADRRCLHDLIAGTKVVKVPQHAWDSLSGVLPPRETTASTGYGPRAPQAPLLLAARPPGGHAPPAD
jgi:uncharacterized RDD family membrane protein YckC